MKHVNFMCSSNVSNVLYKIQIGSLLFACWKCPLGGLVGGMPIYGSDVDCIVTLWDQYSNPQYKST